MKKLFFVISLILCCTSCFLLEKGQWADGQCRPKNPNFKLLKIPFKETDKIAFNKVYDGAKTSLGLGFYKDGRLICFNSDDGMTLTLENIIGESWGNAITIGCWRVKDDNIKIEFFVCQDGGFYNRKKGEIKGDTIVFYQNYYSPIPPFKEKREERYVLTNMSFR